MDLIWMETRYSVLLSAARPGRYACSIGRLQVAAACNEIPRKLFPDAKEIYEEPPYNTSRIFHRFEKINFWKRYIECGMVAPMRSGVRAKEVMRWERPIRTVGVVSIRIRGDSNGQGRPVTFRPSAFRPPSLAHSFATGRVPQNNTASIAKNAATGTIAPTAPAISRPKLLTTYSRTIMLIAIPGAPSPRNAALR
jgi:hypothetical protein